MSKPKTNGIKIHPVAELLPMMDDAAFAGLLADIDENGVRNAIVFLGDSWDDAALVDGRNRLKAVQSLGLDYRDNSTLISRSEMPDPLAFSRSMNEFRRHWTDGQRAMYAEGIATYQLGQNQHSIQQKEGVQIKTPSTRNDAAKSMDVSLSSVNTARRITETAAPEIVEAVQRGSVSLAAADWVAKLPKSEQKKLAKAGPKAIKEAAAKQRKGKISGGTKFDPAELESPGESEPIEPEPTTAKVPAHLVQIIEGTKEGKSIVRDIQNIARRLKAYMEEPAGSWQQQSDIELNLRKVESSVKFGLFACNCPVCKNKPTTKCGKCGGRGWLDKRHESMLTNDERAWLEAQA